MTPERWQQISRIFKSAIVLDKEARGFYVADQCGGDESLRAEVEKLIESHQDASANSFMKGMAAEVAAPLLIGDEVGLPERTLAKGQLFGSYIILDTLGAGGMGQVYLARDTRLDRTVALKVLSPDISQDKRRMQRFHQEARVASSLNHPNILTVFEFGEVEGLTFLATEFIDGETLRTHLHGKRLNLAEVLDISIQILAALDAAHEARIAHRDIKPENVMMRRRDGVVKVLDFGLAKVADKGIALAKGKEQSEAATEFKTAPGIIMGTINYMSPEQAQASTIDERTDIWSTGVMMYEMITGDMPFIGATSAHTILQILEKDPVPLTKLVQVPEELERIVAKAMTKSLDERYQSAKDMLIDLRSFRKRWEVDAELQGTFSLAKPRVTTGVGNPQPTKTRVLMLALTSILVVTGVIFGINVWRSARVNSNTAETTSALPPTQRTLTYWITVQKYKDDRPYENPFTVAGEINFEANYQIRVNVRSPQSGYLYILNEGPTSAAPEYNVVFPSTTANKGSSLLAAGQVVQIPEQSWLVFDKQQGLEKLWLVFSEDAVPELEAVKQFANRQTAGLIADAAQNQGIKTFLDTHSATKPEAERGDTLTTLKAPGKLLVYAVKLEHH